MDAPTRQRVVHLILHNGPQTAKALAEALDLTPAAVRRHLTSLMDEGTLQSREERVYGPRGRGRPSKVFLLTDRARSEFQHDYDQLALLALKRLTQGELQEIAQERVQVLEDRFEAAREAEPDRPAIDILVEALEAENYAAGVRPVRSGDQIVQFHCPVADVAAKYPVLCEIETRLFARLLGSHVQRLATIAHGDGVCTTHVPTALPTPNIPRKKVNS
ncbi:metalloregulator ArsR/SmtB family transcription factor [Tessaracoccus sp. OH4464_COT-324]|uniref:helix-turn-helix transcriptional regulator n=1 Tax=Tessaracoccus sp. OH4464_COT-324 TaxID=2491059 RepID=UPI000F630660|nr:helix-turn-helix domain-containing protein [Tessaracoccus sp. OH4464_COT-324]RRD47717.1 ArsR family transcriptional regulator [Tessaracoccus sp. OH4464_COT-324]